MRRVEEGRSDGQGAEHRLMVTKTAEFCKSSVCKQDFGGLTSKNWNFNAMTEYKLFFNANCCQKRRSG